MRTSFRTYNPNLGDSRESASLNINDSLDEIDVPSYLADPQPRPYVLNLKKKPYILGPFN